MCFGNITRPIVQVQDSRQTWYPGPAWAPRPTAATGPSAPPQVFAFNAPTHRPLTVGSAIRRLRHGHFTNRITPRRGTMMFNAGYAAGMRTAAATRAAPTARAAPAARAAPTAAAQATRSGSKPSKHRRVSWRARATLHKRQFTVHGGVGYTRRYPA
jgi:hypothetical protein